MLTEIQLYLLKSCNGQTYDTPNITDVNILLEKGFLRVVFIPRDTYVRVVATNDGILYLQQEQFKPKTYVKKKSADHCCSAYSR